MKLFNTKTNQIEVFKPIKENEVSMYVCGPTVYGDAHIGNTRPIIIFDTLRRLLRALNYTVDFVSNYTDVDDKIINKALAENVDETVITKRYIDAYESVRQSLNTLPVLSNPKVTETIPEIVDFIHDLVDKGYAYNVDGNVYFRVEKADQYGEISKQKIEDLLVGARIEAESEKENPLDFTLWKKTNDGIQWDSPWGKGRPGWHTECVVMIHDHFHHLIDIHGGGMDLKFPHHENEVAQSRACFNHGLANVWMHNGMLNIDGEKMSKSLGNVMLAKDMIKLLGGNVVRWLMLSAHYRAPINITEEVIETAKIEVNKAIAVLKQVEIKSQLLNYDLNTSETSNHYTIFLDAMQDDLNTPNAMKSVFDVIKSINSLIRAKELKEELRIHYHDLLKMLEVLGIIHEVTVLNHHQIELYHLWNNAKENKDFALADTYRQALMNENVLV
jgi:cysteinyl-tRNA synthetase